MDNDNRATYFDHYYELTGKERKTFDEHLLATLIAEAQPDRLAHACRLAHLSAKGSGSR